MDTQIYSATYSNVPVFEFVTPEGPIMRRKLDSWINATHILKIARFPKAKRTRILEKDVQTGIHEKVQGGYGKYQGTYVPLKLGAEIAQSFGVYDVLRPIFEFEYVEGKSDTPPPAPKHSHASASNVARRQLSSGPGGAAKATKMNSEPKKRGRPKRVPDEFGEHGGSNGPLLKRIALRTETMPSMSRQDTEQDDVASMRGSMNVKHEDLEADTTDESDENNDPDDNDDHEEDALMSGRDLGLVTPRTSFNYDRPPRSFNGMGSINSNNSDPYGLLQYHHMSTQPHRRELVHDEYFNSLLNYFLEDKVRSEQIPPKLASPPQPLSSINITRSIDNDGNTIFHWACSMANTTAIQFLLSTFSSYLTANVKNTNGETPLMFAVKFSNAYQWKNFPVLLEILFDSLLLVDNSGMTVLHHIVKASLETVEDGKKERFAKYYMESLIERLIQYEKEGLPPDHHKTRPGTATLSNNRRAVVYKFFNHQDVNGNTAFHIAAYHLRKKLIKVLITYHSYIDFDLKNLVNYSVEDYLATFNYVLRLDSESKKAGVDGISHEIAFAGSTMSFDSQSHITKMAVKTQNKASNLITERLSQLSYSMEKELMDQDAKLRSHFLAVGFTTKRRLESQREILQHFRLEYLLDENDGSVDPSRDALIQDEIHRLHNDLCFQVLHQKDLVDKVFAKLKRLEYILQNRRVVERASELVEEGRAGRSTQLQEAVQLQKLIHMRRELLDTLYQEKQAVPMAISMDDVKENMNHANTSGDDEGIISMFPQDDKLYKYCKLISLCCGMSMKEVELSIDLIELSLSKAGG